MNSRQLDFDWQRGRADPAGESIEVDGRRIEIVYQRNDQAKRYGLYVDREGQPRVTIPRRGSKREAQRFLERHTAWLVERLQRFAARPGRISRWTAGSEILFRGQMIALQLLPDGDGWTVCLGSEIIRFNPPSDEADTDLREAVETHLRKLACGELPPRVLELAAQHASPVRRITIRDQATRWGSCSRRGTVSLNWRLVQVPISVRDYIILHELMHLREMNHSPRFWAHVAKVCPDFESCETWLRKHSPAIL